MLTVVRQFQSTSAQFHIRANSHSNNECSQSLTIGALSSMNCDLETAYCIYSCISRPFTTRKSTQKLTPDLYTSHTQRPDQAAREISITTAWTALGKPVIIVVDFHQFSAHSSSTKKCKIITGLHPDLLKIISIVSFDLCNRH